MREVAKRFGLGHRYELGVTGGKSGSVPNDAWKRKVIGEQWYAGDTISAAIGQGYVTATPFQLAVMCGRIASGGTMPNPHLRRQRHSECPTMKSRRWATFKPGVMEAVRGGMFGVTAEPGGTAYNYLQGGSVDPKGELPAPYTNAKMAGKSGTAQVRVIQASERNSRGEAIKNDKLPWKLRDHALFIAYAPADKPRYACAIVVEHGVSGSGLAAPIARDLLAHALKYDTGRASPSCPSRRKSASAEQVKT